jgi:transcriptional regulator with XRE-family HTH domain
MPEITLGNLLPMTSTPLPSGMRVLTACQIRAARAMLRMSVSQLAAESGVSESSIRRIEAVFGLPRGVGLDLVAKLHVYLQARGFVFTWDDDKPGIRWLQYKPDDESAV